tara:strand:+ start:10557 stop:10808 length:252 start_codon:yes stop_codon:yes gene_type:complete
MKLADGYEDAFVGTTISAFSRKQVALYDYDKCIMILMHDNNWSEEEAVEWFDYNTIGAWDGDDTPIFINQHNIKDIEDYLDEE